MRSRGTSGIWAHQWLHRATAKTCSHRGCHTKNKFLCTHCSNCNIYCIYKYILYIITCLLTCGDPPPVNIASRSQHHQWQLQHHLCLSLLRLPCPIAGGISIRRGPKHGTLLTQEGLLFVICILPSRSDLSPSAHLRRSEDFCRQVALCFDARSMLVSLSLSLSLSLSMISMMEVCKL